MTFDHNRDASKVYDGNLPHLEQKDENGNLQLYTNSEYDKVLEKWIPEPILITEEDQFKMYEKKVEELMRKAIPMLENLMPIAKGIEIFSRKAEVLRNETDKKYKSALGQIMYLKRKLDEYETEAKSLELKRQMDELENQKRKPGRPKKVVKTIEVEK